MPRPRREYSARLRSGALAQGLLLALACSGNGPAALEVGRDADGSEVTMGLGTSLDVILGNVGPGTYTSPPAIDGTALRYEGVEVVPPYLPSGPRQRFRFRAVAPGTARVTLSKTDRVGAVHASAYVLYVVIVR